MANVYLLIRLFSTKLQDICYPHGVGPLALKDLTRRV